jgi:hypothetical protein
LRNRRDFRSVLYFVVEKCIIWLLVVFDKLVYVLVDLNRRCRCSSLVLELNVVLAWLIGRSLNLNGVARSFEYLRSLIRHHSCIGLLTSLDRTFFTLIDVDVEVLAGGCVVIPAASRRLWFVFGSNLFV